MIQPNEGQIRVAGFLPGYWEQGKDNAEIMSRVAGGARLNRCHGRAVELAVSQELRHQNTVNVVLAAFSHKKIVAAITRIFQGYQRLLTRKC